MLNLIKLSQDKFAKVICIEGGFGITRRLQDLGIREGVVIRKITGLFTNGPIIVKAGSTQIALGRGMAFKVMVEPL